MISIRNPQAIIFDLDGTLLNTIEDLADCCNSALATEDLEPISVNEYKLHIGSGARNLVESSYASALGTKLGRQVKVNELNADKVDELYKLYNDAYADGWAKKTQPYPGVKSLLEKLKAAGYRLAVLSNKPDNFTREMTDHYFSEGTFDLVLGKRADWPLKPDPASTIYICEELGVPPEMAVLIGDSGSDIETAIRAGVQAWAVLWGFRDYDELSRAGAEEFFANVTELEQKLLHNQFLRQP